MQAVEGAVVPQAPDAEAAVLGAMMRDGEAAVAVQGILKPDHFYAVAHRKIYRAMVALSIRGEPIDLATVAGELEKAGDLDKCGGAAALMDIADSVYTAVNAPAHARIVLEKAALRTFISRCEEAHAACYAAPGDAADLIEVTQAHLSDLVADLGAGKDQYRSAGSILPETTEAIEAYRHGGSGNLIPTGFYRLDEMLGGLRAGELVVIAGRPSMGKTALGLTIAVQIEAPVAIFSLEMSDTALVERMVCAQANIAMHRLRCGTLSHEEYDRLGTGMAAISRRQIFIDQSVTLSAAAFRARAQKIVRQTGAKIIIVDYIQLMTGPVKSENRQTEIAAISRTMKAVARDLGVCVVAISQLSRAVEQRGGDRKPMLSDLRESGAIEQDADAVLFVWRPIVYDKSAGKTDAEIIVAKQRNGPTGAVPVVFLPEPIKFANRAGG